MQFTNAHKGSHDYTGKINGKTYVVRHHMLDFYTDHYKKPIPHSVVTSREHIVKHNPNLTHDEIDRVHTHIKDIHKDHMKEGAEHHAALADHTKNPYHKTLMKHGFVHSKTTHEPNKFAPHPDHDSTVHVYTHPGHGKSHVHIVQNHTEKGGKQGAYNAHWIHRHEQKNGLMAPSTGETKPQLHKSLAREYGEPTMKEEVDMSTQMNEDENHPYHKYTNDQLKAVIRDTHRAAHALMGSKSSLKYAEKHDLATSILEKRKKSQSLSEGASVEQLDELSRETIQRYLDKVKHTSKTHGDAAHEYLMMGFKKKLNSAELDAHKTSLRKFRGNMRGMGNAVRRLLKRPKSTIHEDVTMNVVKAVVSEAVSRKHFQQVADVIKSHPDAAKRKELAHHHSEIFAKQNPRFDRKRFFAAAGADHDK